MNAGEFSRTELGDALDELRETLPTIIPPPGEVVAFTPELAVRIIDAHIQGQTLRKIAEDLPGMPDYRTLLRWSKEVQAFREALYGLRDVRAFHYEQMCIEAAEAAQGKDADRLKVETYRWAAEVNDPTRYGPKRASGGGDGNVQVIINTGFGAPNEWQQPPKLGPDGLVIREKRVSAEVVDDVVQSEDRRASTELVESQAGAYEHSMQILPEAQPASGETVVPHGEWTDAPSDPRFRDYEDPP